MQEHFLREAIRLSIDPVQAGEGGPFGAVIVKDGQIVGRGCNLPASQRSLPTTRALREEALAAFEAWANKEDRVEY